MGNFFVFQLAASTIASVSSGASLMFWLILIANRDLSKIRLLHRNPTLLCQAIIGAIVFMGTIISIFLAAFYPVWKQVNDWTMLIAVEDPSRPILTFETGVLLALPTIHEVILLTIIIIVTDDSSFFSDGISPRSRHLIYSVVLALTVVENIFIFIQYLRLWIICAANENSPRVHSLERHFFYLKMFVCPSTTVISRHRRALWAATTAAGLLSLISMIITVLGYMIQPLWTQFATVMLFDHMPTAANGSLASNCSFELHEDALTIHPLQSFNEFGSRRH
ncbi:predicted protein [Histoplasma capsulatum G186AR]|uniref:Uncharacterized protein n=1 Tax=Ajellomyces capsulatus (strain G186AR / H82 / ATCC MYA-2454 / RMSCC 2432) TaxID=447093 RepID=C0P0Y4_AJECG|nr:uncharacterized protein HCBG_09064 [Histoplasma capsulatum G186AR]EEH02620.1 predicted protein [Histoplasma capsulatum G186AR]